MNTRTTRTLLLLGGSAQQIIAIQKAKQCGYRTVVCDYLPDNPGQYHADAFYLASTTNKEAVLEVARAEHVDGVVAYASDPAAPTAAYVAEKLGLPTNPYSSVKTLSTKTLFREHMRSIGLPCPESVSIDAHACTEEVRAAISSLRLPVVVKPTDSSGSKGVTVVHDRSDLASLEAALQNARRFGRNGLLIAEEYIGGPVPRVLGGDIFVKDGQICFWGLTDCVRTAGLPHTPSLELLPPTIPACQSQAMRKSLEKLVSSLGIRFGAMNVEIIMGEDGTPYVLELAARAGGNMIPVQLSDASGIDLVRAIVMCAMGDDPGDLTWEPYDECIAGYVAHTLAAGTYKGYSLSPQARAACYREVPYVEPGTPVEPFVNAQHALGVLFFRFDNAHAMHDFASHITDHVVVHVI